MIIGASFILGIAGMFGHNSGLIIFLISIVAISSLDRLEK